MHVLTPELAARFARIALGHVEREYPNKPGHVLDAAEDAGTPRALHPIFFGSFDWHSCVHSYWLLARVLRRYPASECAAAIVSLFDRRLEAAAVAGECAYFERPSARGYERPYGWAWLLKLTAELRTLPDRRWADALAPLAAIIVARFETFLPIATYPIRAGTHGNTAFALRLAADYDGAGLETLLRETALRWYGDDVGCTAWGEPGGDDFLSSALIEAECMRRLLGPDFAAWLPRFMPRLPLMLQAPVRPSDRSDGKIAHLDGLNLSRAWCLRALGWPDAAETHLAAAMPHLDAHYMGEHWLATYAMLALDETGETR